MIQKRIDEGRIRIGKQQHVRCLNTFPPGNGGTIEEVAGFEFLRSKRLDRDAHVLFLAARVGKAEIDEFNVLILDCLEYVFWGHSLFLALSNRSLFFIESAAEILTENAQHSAINKKSLRPLK